MKKSPGSNGHRSGAVGVTGAGGGASELFFFSLQTELVVFLLAAASNVPLLVAMLQPSLTVDFFSNPHQLGAQEGAVPWL